LRAKSYFKRRKKGGAIVEVLPARKGGDPSHGIARGSTLQKIKRENSLHWEFSPEMVAVTRSRTEIANIREKKRHKALE